MCFFKTVELELKAVPTDLQARPLKGFYTHPCISLEIPGVYLNNVAI